MGMRGSRLSSRLCSSVFLVAALAVGALVYSGSSAWGGAVLGSNLKTLKLSDTFTLSWDPEQARFDVNFAPSFSVFLLQGKKSSQEFLGQVRVQRPPFVGTPTGILRYWKQNLELVSKLGEVSHDLGCHLQRPGTWECTRLARGSAGNYVADRMVWNRNSDLIYLRISSVHSQEHARAALDSLKWELQP